MKIKNEKPPIWDRVRKTNLDFNPDLTIFTYGDTIYNPAALDLPDHLIVHEETHEKQQGDDPDAWWDKYLIDQYFRTSQEIEAYANQYAYVCKFQKDRNRRAKFLVQLAHIMASPMYGEVIDWIDAMKMIRKKSNVK